MIFALFTVAVLPITSGSPMIMYEPPSTEQPYSSEAPAEVSPFSLPEIPVDPPLCPICSCNPPPNCTPRSSSIRFLCLFACPNKAIS
ncbi:hypothetical protein Y032_0069g401 [Ancylostoma ceylanicum]|nr:hypothetical protein Y032_0069g401 [Ancylostoma ceylanicum]